MEDDSSSSSVSSTRSRQERDIDKDINAAASFTPTNEITEDLTVEANGVSTPETDEEPVGLIVVDRKYSREKDVVKPRAYQMEMLEESLGRNIIVAMDTGSGKTHIAVLRILHELERMPSSQLIWFLAPTVSLCAQQFGYLQSQITSVHMKYLSGADGVDRWTEQKLWDALLRNVKVVVSTYQILLDALTHAFVKMESLALIVFDEAHNCVGKHAGAKIMQIFYHGRKSEGRNVPHILGLTASPIMRSQPTSLNKIEETLDAICRTPKKHRSELRLQIKLPVFSQVYFEGPSSDVTLTEYPRSIKSLGMVFRSLKIGEDPFVQALIEEDTERSRRSLDKLLLNHKTWTHEQIKAFYNKSIRIYEELGAWAADHYIAEVVSNSAKLVGSVDEGLFGPWHVVQSENQYLANLLSKVEINRTDSASATATPAVSNKVEKLIETLVNQSSDFRGIIFVQERAAAEVLTRLLKRHPQTSDIFRVGTMIGTSAHANRARNIAEVVDWDSQKHVLGSFRNGDINLMIATSVLEEGIDVPACNVVLCFQKPVNLKSFVQRRGRARQKESQLILFLDASEDGQKLADFQQLEEMMKRIYEDDMRILSEIVALENEEEEQADRFFCVTCTGAVLVQDSAVSHLHHFCATLPAKEYVDLRPEFVCSIERGLIRARVILPLLVDESVRTAKSLFIWKSERNAIKDAAFEAYIALYKAGLVNVHLLPLMHRDEEADDLLSSTIDKRAAIVEVHEQLDPWIAVSQAWKENDTVRCTSLRVGDLEMEIFLPVEIPPVAPFSLYWDASTEISVTPDRIATDCNPESYHKARIDTHLILDAGYGKRFPVLQQQQVMSFSPKDKVDVQRLSGQVLLAGIDPVSLDSNWAGLVRDSLAVNNIAYKYKGYLRHKPAVETVRNPYIGYENTPQDEPHLSVKQIPRRNDFLHKLDPSSGPTSSKEHSTVLPVSRCLMDKMPFSFIQFALFLPSILHRFGIYLLAKELSTTILKDVQISNLDLVVTAICASSAQESTNYQRLEFLGDSILKLCTSIELMAQYPRWHEGLLSFRKDRLVSNGRLARAAAEAGIDKFIITNQFKANKWRPLYIEDLAYQTNNAMRNLSSKVLADVVEALIGAATFDGGTPKALACLLVFLPEFDWIPLAASQSLLFQRAADVPLPPILEPLEELIGYPFTKKSLLIEAVTHASYLTSSGSSSLERLEFLGDAILDNIIVTEMFPHNLSHVQMHTLRTAMVNADFLAWVCLEWSTEIRTSHINASLVTESKMEQWPLWRFMRHTSFSLSKAQRLTAARYRLLRREISDAIDSGTHYPWALLARLDAMKFFSDIIESLLGAIWIDSYSQRSGSASSETNFEACRATLERMGILKYMRRILKDGVHVLHPKEELGILADSETVKYVIESRKQEGGEQMVEYLCTVFVGDERIVGVEGGVSKVEAKTTAAEKAVRILKGRESKKKGKEGYDTEMVDEMEGILEDTDGRFPL